MAERPTILVTNDDGQGSPGLTALAAGLAPLGDVWVVAPKTEQSAVSHALTMRRPLRVERVGERSLTVDGTPTDCVNLAFSGLLDGRPVLVVSGINLGCNMGADVHYSGTVSAAFEGVIFGTPAMAVSQRLGGSSGFEHAARLAHDLAAWILEHGLPAGTLLNVNVPAGVPRGVRLTRLGVRRYMGDLVETEAPNGDRVLVIGGGDLFWEAADGSDFHEVGLGFASVTPLNLDVTDFGLLGRLLRQRPPWCAQGDGRD